MLKRLSRLSRLTIFLIACAIPALCSTGISGEEADVKPPAPKTVSLSGERALLSDWLDRFIQQTGIRVERRTRENPTLQMNLKQATFWEGLDAIAREAHARVSPYGGLSLVDASGPSPRVSYDGLFRTSVKKIVGVHDLENGAHYYVASLEVAWEPDFKPYFLETRPQSYVIQDDRGHDVSLSGQGTEQTGVYGRTTQEVDVRFHGLDRSVRTIRLLKGQMSITGPTKMLTFVFDMLKAQQQLKQEGVAVTLSKITQNEKVWTVRLAIEYPPGGPKFDSYQSQASIVNNEILLKNASGQVLSSSSYASDSLTPKHGLIDYNFKDNMAKPLLRGSKAEDWQLIYKAPARIIEIPIRFEFKEVPLP